MGPAVSEMFISSMKEKQITLYYVTFSGNRGEEGGTLAPWVYDEGRFRIAMILKFRRVGEDRNSK